MEEKIRQALARVRGVYAEIEELGFSRNCTGRTTCCRFKLTGKTPMLTSGEALVAAAGLRASGKKELPSPTDSDGRCPLLSASGSCTIYQDRPVGCRTHFCSAAGGPIGRNSVGQHIRRLEEIAESLEDTDVRPIATAITRALPQLPRRTRRKRRK